MEKYEHALNASCAAILGSIVPMAVVAHTPLWKCRSNSITHHFIEQATDIRIPISVASGLLCSSIYQATSVKNLEKPTTAISEATKDGQITETTKSRVS